MENQIIVGKTVGLIKYVAIFIAIGVIAIIVAVYGENTGNLADLSPFLYILGCLFFVAAIVFFFYGNNCEIVVTDKRVYGKASFGKRVDLPIDSLSSVGIGAFGSVSVGTSSGRISFIAIENKEKIHEEINNIIMNRSVSTRQAGSISNTTTIVKDSNADELKKFKNLLDEGVITQEEFQAKKKQLLGL